MSFVSRTLASFAVAAVAFGCNDTVEDAREAQLTNVLAAADEVQIRTRGALVAGKYARMAAGAYDFYRGSLALYRHDARSGTTKLSVSRFDLDYPLVPSLGDPHPENFGVLRAADGSLGFEPNDFDASERAPWLWDVRRLAIGVALAAMSSNPEDPDAQQRATDARRDVARAAAAGYRSAIYAAATGSPPARITSPGTSSILEDAFSRSERDQGQRRELADRTILTGDVRRLVRGVADPEDPQNVYAELLPSLAATLPDAIERYRRTLVAPPPAEHFRILDAVREFGSGVASWPRVRVILLVRGPTDDPGDDLMLEMKELVDSTLGGLYPPGVFADSVGARVLTNARAAWGSVDAEPYWGVTHWLGLPCQIRLESEGQKGIRVERLEGARGTPEALAELATILGSLVARVHRSSPRGVEDARAIVKRIDADPEGFLDEQADAATAYADQALADHVRFRRALVRHGPRLGIPFDPADVPRPDLALLFGVPPPPPTVGRAP